MSECRYCEALLFAGDVCVMCGAAPPEPTAPAPPEPTCKHCGVSRDNHVRVKSSRPERTGDWCWPGPRVGGTMFEPAAPPEPTTPTAVPKRPECQHGWLMPAECPWCLRDAERAARQVAERERDDVRMAFAALRDVTDSVVAERDQARERVAELEAANAATRPLDEIAALCGCPHWDYPAQVVRDVQELVRKLAAVRLAVAGAPEPTTHAAVRAALKDPE